MTTEKVVRYRLRHKHPCPDCGKPIHQNSKRCKSCFTKHRWRNGELRASFAKRRGENSPYWKGGKYTKNGYIFRKADDHPRASRWGYVQEHILIWEEAHGKPLPDGWIVHHLNGIRADNRRSNLIALPNKKHYLVLQAKAKRIQELEALLNNQGHLF